MYSMMNGTSKISDDVRSSWSVMSPRRSEMARSDGSSNSSSVTSHGPVGPKPAYDFANPHCGEGPLRCSVRSDTSWPIVKPATCDHADAAVTFHVGRAMAATSSTSKSVVSTGITTSWRCPTMHAGHFGNTVGSSGALNAPSAAWAR